MWHRWGDGPAVVLLHGGHGSWTHWVRNIGPLADRFTVFVPDLPGCGDSALPPGSVTVSTIVRILMKGLRRLLPTGGRYHLIGFSFGGALSGPLALMDQARVRSVTLVGPGGLPRLRPHLELRQWRSVPDAVRSEAHRENLATLMIADPAAIDDLAVRLQAANAARGRLNSREISADRILADSLPHVHAPVGAIFGELDATVHPRLHERVALLRRLSPRIDIRVVAGAGHWVQYEAPDEFNRHVVELIRRGGRVGAG